MKLKFILLLLTFSANVFLFSQNKTSNNKKSESVENRKTGKKDTTQLSEIEIGKREVLKKLYGDKPYGSLYVGHDRQDYEAMGYGEVAEAENWNTLVPPRDMAERARKYEEKNKWNS